MPSPPKPWEVSGAAGGAGPVPTATTTSAAPASAAQSGQTTASTAGPPPVPTRPDSASVASAGYSSTMSGYNSGYGASPYGSQMASQYGTQYGAGYGSTLSPYASRYGAGSTYGGYGSTYGSTYGGGYGAGGYGGVGGYSRYGGTGYGTMPYNRFGGGPPYGPGGPGDMPLSAQLEQSTQATFNTLDSIVQAFAGFAQMLESTFMATHSSFMAMVGVAEQFGNLKSYLGQLFSVMSLYRLAKRIYCKLTGRAPPVDVASLNADSFKDFQEGKDGKKRSKKPLWVFLLFTIGIPYAISKLFQRLQKQRLEAAANAPEGALPLVGPDGNRLGPQEIRNLDFGRVLYDFNAENPGELSLPKGEIVAILSKIDPATGQPGLWWRGRLQAGQMGMFPANYVELIPKKFPVNDAEILQPMREAPQPPTSFTGLGATNLAAPTTVPTVSQLADPAQPAHIPPQTTTIPAQTPQAIPSQPRPATPSSTVSTPSQQLAPPKLPPPAKSTAPKKPWEIAASTPPTFKPPSSMGNGSLAPATPAAAAPPGPKSDPLPFDPAEINEGPENTRFGPSLVT